MKFHGIDMQGKLQIQSVASLPTWTASDQRRFVYVSTEDKYYFGGASGWILANGLNWVEVTAATYTAKSGDFVLANSVGTAQTITLPATPTKGMTVSVCDIRSNSGTNNITVDRNGEKIGGTAANLVISTNGQCSDFIYYDSTIGWAVKSSGGSSGGGGSGGVGDIIMYPNSFTFDADTNGVDSGIAFGIVECLDFRYDLDGKVIGTIPWPSSWTPATKGVKFKIYYNLNGSDNGKNVRLSMDYWVINNGGTPNISSPTASNLVDDIASASGNTNAQNELILTNCAVIAANTSINTKEIVFTLGRLGANAADTYGGTLQITKVIAYNA